jgi:hypothetical protein
MAKDDVIVLQESSFDIIEEADRYFLIAKNNPTKTIAIGNRDRLKLICQDIPADMIIATSGSEEKCLVFTDYLLGDLMNIIVKYRKLVN